MEISQGSQSDRRLVSRYASTCLKILYSANKKYNYFLFIMGADVTISHLRGAKKKKEVISVHPTSPLFPNALFHHCKE